MEQSKLNKDLERIKQSLCDQLNTANDDEEKEKILLRCKDFKEKILKLLEKINS